MMMTALQVDLVNLIEQKSGVSLMRASRHYRHGSEYCGPCPFCEMGRDRFRVWPEAEQPHYWCRVCERSGTIPGFLMDYCDLTYRQALRELDADAGDFHNDTPRPAPRDGEPSPEWQKMARLVVERAELALWHTDSGALYLRYLRARKLKDETIKQARIGYIPLMKDGSFYHSPFEYWGIDPAQATEAQRAKGGLLLPEGILIPWFEGERLWKLAIKRPGRDVSYGQIRGSCEGLYNAAALQPGRPAMMVESEIDCLSVMQEAGDLLTCVATGSASRGRRPNWQRKLAQSAYVLQSFDEDEAGDKGAAYWLNILPQCTRWSPGSCKDANEILQSEPGGACTLRQWVMYGMLNITDYSVPADTDILETVVEFMNRCEG